MFDSSFRERRRSVQHGPFETFVTEIRQYKPIDHCHSHPHHQIILPLSGALELEINGQYGRASAMQGAVVPGNFQHTFRGVGDNRFVVVDLPAQLSTDYWSDDLCRFLETPNFFALDSGLYHYTRLAGIESCRNGRNPNFSIVLAELLAELLAHRFTSAKSIRLTRRLGPALEYIASHLDQRISVSRLAALSHLSIGRFHTTFREYTGRTPSQYVTELRMQRALALLQETGWAVARVSAALGYSSQSAFTHTFKRYFGVSPSRYHRQTSA
jgi:AraC-type DNA-binding domain-containing proteins